MGWLLIDYSHLEGVGAGYDAGLVLSLQIVEHLADVKLLNGLVLESDAPEVGGEVDTHKVRLQMSLVLTHKVLEIFIITRVD